MGGAMDLARSKRMDLRRPVNMEVHCELARGAFFKGRGLNLSTGGLFLRTREPVVIERDLNLKFRLPSNLNVIETTGVAVWSRFHCVTVHQEKPFHTSGIKFLGLAEPYRDLIQEYTFEMLCDEKTIRKQGIQQLMKDIRNLPPHLRLKAYSFLIKREEPHTVKGTLGMPTDDNEILEPEIQQQMKDIRNLPPHLRLKAYQSLIKK
jgi:hypothetical protein